MCESRAEATGIFAAGVLRAHLAWTCVVRSQKREDHYPEHCVPRRKELEGQTGRMTIQFGLVGCQEPVGHTSRGPE